MALFQARCFCGLLLLVSFALQPAEGGGSGGAVLPFSGSGSGELSSVFEPNVTTYGNLTCESFHTETSSCYSLLKDYPSFVTNHSRSDQEGVSGYIQFIIGVLHNLKPSPLCIQVAIPLLCRYSFPTCDPSYLDPTYQPICRRDCKMIRDFICPTPWQGLQAFSASVNLVVLDDFDCEPLRDTSAGNSPMCISTLTEGEIPLPLKTGDQCYTGDGRGYNGTVSMTESGLECQSWKQSYPHQHLLHYQNYLEIQGGHNFCRNPGGRGERPWCFTTSRDTRWEYCDVLKCAPGPECEFYTGDICYGQGPVGLDHVYINTSIATQTEYEERMNEFYNTIANFDSKCRDAFMEYMCISTFSSCDLSHPQPRPHQVCRSYCELVTELCREDLDKLLSFGVLLDIDPLVLPACEDLPEAHGGDSPECYMPITSPTIPANTTTDLSKCYDPADMGFTYNGTANTTASGKPCAPWDSPLPHTHPITSIFRETLANHNYCRNPERRGARPWCYTADPDTRWEYCDIPECIAATSPTDTSERSILDYVIFIAPIAGGVCGALVLLSLLCCICCLCFQNRKASKKVKLSSDMDSIRYTSVKMLDMQKSIEFSKDGFNPLYSTNPMLQAPAEYEGVRLKELTREGIIYIRDLGQGRFGLVVQAEVNLSGEQSETVAIKVLKDGVTPEIRKEFFREATLMNTFDHPNIVRLLGVCIEQDPLCMVFEFMELGDLNNFLRQNVTSARTQPGAALTAHQLVGMAVDVAAGFHYLALNHYIHRDMATRNCLVNAKFRVKISDFGLSQDVYTKDYFRLGDSELLPIRWMPPEAILYAKFNLQSDVWSFGVVLWEIFTFGMQPYFSLTNEEVVQHVRDGNVMSCPDDCPEEIYDLMIDCWAMDPAQRPTAAELHVALQRWNPEFSASLHVAPGDTTGPQAQYQNVSTVLEYAEVGIPEEKEGDKERREKEGEEEGGKVSPYLEPARLHGTSSSTAATAYDHLTSPSETVSTLAIPNQMAEITVTSPGTTATDSNQLASLTHVGDGGSNGLPVSYAIQTTSAGIAFPSLPPPLPPCTEQQSGQKQPSPSPGDSESIL